MKPERLVKLFRNGRNQAVRFSVECELPGNEALMHRDGNKLVIELVRRRSLLEVLATLEPLDEPFPRWTRVSRRFVRSICE